MITARLLTTFAASSLAAIAYAQTQPAPSTQPGASPGYNTASPHQREMRSAPGNEAAPPGSRPAPGAGSLETSQSAQKTQAPAMRMAEAAPGGKPWSNMPVETPSGQSLGSVSNVVAGLNGQKTSGYVVVSGAGGMSVPVPYRTASAMVRGGKLVLSQSRFEQAPKVTQEDLQNSSNRSWRVKADKYWKGKAHGK
jgi:hypothetical protein